MSGESDPLMGRKILFAPHEIGGQMQLMAEELRRRGYHATAATYSQEWFGHANDINLDLNRLKSKAARHVLNMLFALWAAGTYDVFHFFWGGSLYGWNRFPHLDLPLLRRSGKTIVVHFRGTDVLDVGYFEYLSSLYGGNRPAEPAMSRADQLRSLATWRRYADRILVSWPGLLRLIPDATVLPPAVDLSYWKSSLPVPAGQKDGKIRVAHAPSMRRKKGTEFVERSVSELSDSGYPVELVLIENVPFHRVKALYEQCDIGVDQVLAGWYGKVSIELMAMGRPVVCHIDPQWLPGESDLPIVSARADELTARLELLIRDAALRRRLGEQGRQYVEKHHDVARIVDQCLQIYQESTLS